jgi:hypothetical protein
MEVVRQIPAQNQIEGFAVRSRQKPPQIRQLGVF